MTAQADFRTDAEDIAEKFVTARLEARALPQYPGDIPTEMSQSYAIQNAAIALFPDNVVGWKVGGVPPAQQPVLGVHRVAGAIFAGNVRTSGDQPMDVQAIKGGFTAIEAEFIARVGVDLDPAKIDWTIEEAAAQIDKVFIGIEVAGSPLSAINDLGSAVVASDFGNNAGLILGPELTDWRDRIDAVQVETVIDGESVGKGGATSLAGGALESVRFLIEHCARWGRPLKAGDLISTGAVTGVHRIYEGSKSVCIFEGVGELHCSIVAAEPRASKA